MENVSFVDLETRYKGLFGMVYCMIFCTYRTFAADL